MILYMYIALGQGQTTPGDKIVMSTETSCLKKKPLLSLILYNFLHDFTHVYCPRAGTDNPFGTKFLANRNSLSLWSFVASFKRISLKSDFIQLFHDFIRL